MNRVRIGIIGTGIGVTHIGVFNQVPEAEVVAVCSAQRQRAEAVAARYNIPFATDDYRELLGERVDALVIATPPALHAEIGLAAIAAGKHIFCEKPLAATLAEARTLRDAARAAGVVHMINLQLRCAPAYAWAAGLLREGYLGRLVMAYARISMNPADYLRASWASGSKVGWFADESRGGGLLASSAGPHLIDFLLWYGGSIAEVATRTITAQPVVTLADGGEVHVSSEDGFLVLARYVDGGLATARGVPIAHHRGDWRVELHGTNGTLVIDEHSLSGATSADDSLMPIMAVTQEEMESDRTILARRFVEACQTGGPSPAPNFDDGVAIQAVLDACLQAAKSERWVAVEPD